MLAQNRKLWLYWLGVPVGVLLMVPLLVLFLNINNPVLSGQLSTDAYWQGQLALFSYLNQAASAWPAGLLYNLTLMGDAAILLPLALLGIYRCPQIFGALLATLPIGAVLSSVGKKLFAMPRPGAVLDASEFNAIGEFLTGHSSLPSGHSLTYFAVGVAVLVTWQISWQNRSPSNHQRIISGVAILALMGLCLSRVAVGAHWPLDLLVGGSLGTLAGVAGATIAAKYMNCWQAIVYGKVRGIIALGLATWSGALIMRIPDMHYIPVVIYLAAVACVAVMYRLFTMPKQAN